MGKKRLEMIAARPLTGEETDWSMLPEEGAAAVPREAVTEQYRWEGATIFVAGGEGDCPAEERRRLDRQLGEICRRILERRARAGRERE